MSLIIIYNSYGIYRVVKQPSLLTGYPPTIQNILLFYVTAHGNSLFMDETNTKNITS